MSSYLFGAPSTFPNIFAVLQPCQDLLYCFLLLSRLLLLQTLATCSSLLLLKLKSLLHELNILESQFFGNDLQVTDWVDIALDVDNLGIVKAANHLENGIDGTDMRQESVAQASTGRGTTCQTRNIVNSQVCRDARLGLELLAQPVISCVGDDNAGFLRVDSSVGKVGRVAKVALCNGLEQSRFSDVCKADLNESQKTACTCEWSGWGRPRGRLMLTIPLFKLLPGRPRRIFFSSTCFLGGILFFLFE